MISRKQTRQNYDRLSRWYDLFATSEKKFADAGLQLLDVKAGERVLEIGFGTGRSLVTLAQQVGGSGLAAGVELSSGMLDMAGKRLQAEGVERDVGMVQGDGIQLPFVRDTFDAIFLSFTLELFSDDEMKIVLGECRRVLKSKGRLGVVSMAKKNVLACRLYEWGHAHWPTILECRPIILKEHLEAGGFRVQVLKVETMWGLPVEIALSKWVYGSSSHHLEHG